MSLCIFTFSLFYMNMYVDEENVLVYYRTFVTSMDLKLLVANPVLDSEI